MLRGLRLIEIATRKAAGKRKIDHESAMDFEEASARLNLRHNIQVEVSQATKIENGKRGAGRWARLRKQN